MARCGIIASWWRCPPRPWPCSGSWPARPGRWFSKATLLDTVWAETVVSEGTLTNCLSLLRRVLGEDARQPRYIATVHRLGYRFVAPPFTPGGHPSRPWPPRPAAERAQLPAAAPAAAGGPRRRSAPSCTPGLPRRSRAGASSSSSRGRREWAKRPWWTRLWRRWPRRRRPGSGAGSALTTMGRAKPICRCSTPWGAWAGGQRGAQLVACLRQLPPPGWGRWPPVVGEGARGTGGAPGPRMTRQRMLRELAEALEAFTAEHPLIIAARGFALE